MFFGDAQRPVAKRRNGDGAFGNRLHHLARLIGRASLTRLDRIQVSLRNLAPLRANHCGGSIGGVANLLAPTAERMNIRHTTRVQHDAVLSQQQNVVLL